MITYVCTITLGDSRINRKPIRTMLRTLITNYSIVIDLNFIECNNLVLFAIFTTTADI